MDGTVAPARGRHRAGALTWRAVDEGEAWGSVRWALGRAEEGRQRGRAVGETRSGSEERKPGVRRGGGGTRLSVRSSCSAFYVTLGWAGTPGCLFKHLSRCCCAGTVLTWPTLTSVDFKSSRWPCTARWASPSQGTAVWAEFS